MQIPQELPIFKREISNHMYSVHAYFWSKVAQGITAVWFYPVIITICSFYCYGLEYDSFTDMLTYMAALTAICYTGGFLGLMISTMSDDQMVAILLCNLIVTLMNFGAGCLSNTGDDANFLIKFLSWISPMHYGCEIVFKQVSKGRPDDIMD